MCHPALPVPLHCILHACIGSSGAGLDVRSRLITLALLQVAMATHGLASTEIQPHSACQRARLGQFVHDTTIYLYVSLSPRGLARWRPNLAHAPLKAGRTKNTHKIAPEGRFIRHAAGRCRAWCPESVAARMGSFGHGMTKLWPFEVGGATVPWGHASQGGQHPVHFDWVKQGQTHL